MIKEKSYIYDLLQNYVGQHFNLVYNKNLKKEAEERLKLPRKYIHNGAGPQSQPVLTEYSDNMIFGAYMRDDKKTIEYDDDTRIQFVIHEIAHMTCMRTIYDPEKHSPDLYAWQIEHPMANKYYYWCVQEEMTAGFFGFLIQAKLDIIWDCLYYDSTDMETSSKLIFPNKYIDLTNYINDIPIKLKQKTVDNKLYMACDADLSPVYRLPNEQYYTFNQAVLNYPPFKMFGTLHHKLLGILDDDNNIIGRINSEKIKQNKHLIQQLWKIHPNEIDDYIDFWCL